MPDIKIKRGETFYLTGQYMEDDGITPKSLLGITLSSQIRDNSYNLVDTLIITVTNINLGMFTVTSSGITDNWVLGNLFWDLKQTQGGITSLTSTTNILVERAITL